MTTDTPEAERQVLKASIRELCPTIVSEGRADQWAVHFVRLANELGLHGREKRQRFFGFALSMLQDTEGYEDGPALRQPDPDALRRFARDLIRSVVRMFSGYDGESPLPPNKWIVTAGDKTISWDMEGMKQVDKRDALNLAVWIIALVDPTLEDAAHMLGQITTRP